MIKLSVWIVLAMTTGCVLAGSNFEDDPNADRNALPEVPDGFAVTFFAREPLVRSPCSMAFDAKGRLYVGMGPQYRNPKPETPGDSVVLVLDKDGDGVAETTKVFATGFNCIQGMAWHGRDLWIANAPDLTIVRDTNADDEADEYVLVYTDLGNLEHGLHGLNWAPDGKLYMSKGNSKGLTKPGRIAPKPFRDLWAITAPEGTPDFPPLRTFTKAEYRHTFHDPADDWGREGGVLRCDDLGRNLEIVARGMRNPWDITFDSGFNLLGTDNDQNDGDRIFMPFFGAHFGWGHAWSAHWSGSGHLPTVPISGPTFQGSGTGLVFYDAPQFPESHRRVFFINDWLSKTIYLYRPQFDGALMLPQGGKWQEFVRGGKSLFRPTDLEVGPDGALYCLGWSAKYGVVWNKAGEQINEGRVFRIHATGTPLPARQTWHGPKRDKAHAQWSVAELMEDFAGPLPVWRSDAQDELVRRGAGVVLELLNALNNGRLSEGQETWTAWTIGRIAPDDASREQVFTDALAPGSKASLNLKIQSLRILAHRIRVSARNTTPAQIGEQLKSAEARLRFEAALAIGQTRQASHVEALLAFVDKESDCLAFYAGWRALRDLAPVEKLAPLLTDARAGVRRAALLALLDAGSLTAESVTPLLADNDASTREVAALWLSKSKGNPLIVIEPPGGILRDTLSVKLSAGFKNATIHYTLDGSLPGATSPKASDAIAISQTSVLKAVLISAGKPIGKVAEAHYRKKAVEEARQVEFAAKLQCGPNRTQFSASGLKSGEVVYSDRPITFSEVPDAVLGLRYLQLPNNDAGSQGDKYLSFEALLPVTVVLGHDTRITAPPAWMKVGQADGFTATGTTVRSSDTVFKLFTKTYATGEITLGGNTSDGVETGRSNYFAALKVAPLATPKEPVSAAQVLPLISSARVERGEALFFSPGGAGCSACHRIGERGNNFGPDLTGVGERADRQHILQSILEPSAVITEGFSMHTVKTAAGLVVSGMLLEETGKFLTLVSSDGRPLKIEKDEIALHKTLPTSAMPVFNEVLMPQHVADLTAWLESLKTGGKPPLGAASENKPSPVTKAPSPKTAVLPLPSTPGFAATLRDHSIVIAHNGQPIAEYVFKDEKILRPHFANIHTHAGKKVSRNHPPRPGQDAEDHDTMHPGIWMAFGDINGQDFWRNKARIVHERFLAAPAVEDGRLTFTTLNTLVTSDGKPLATQVSRITFSTETDGWLMIWDATIQSEQSDLTFGDQEEMGLGLRMATPLTVTAKKGGRILDGDNRRNEPAIWGRQSAWCDFSGTVDGTFAGIAVVPDPANVRRCWWHARDYGALVANPFGKRSVAADQAAALKLKKGDSLRLRFGVLVHGSASETDFDPTSACEKVIERFKQTTKVP